VQTSPVPACCRFLHTTNHATLSSQTISANPAKNEKLGFDFLFNNPSMPGQMNNDTEEIFRLLRLELLFAIYIKKHDH
jgi:hypothetical protein